ncbi:MAG: class I SAM-dependent methyltransferase [Deltaproteobacteria bacterium]|nr:class I SAM-dependent methyltransferase [Deltaproteobacteria bacterium]
MTDLFEDKAAEWDARPLPAIISEGVGRALLEHVELTPDMQVMDFGAGTGLICCHVAPHVAKIYAVDISEAMLEQLAAKPELQGKVEPVCRDILEAALEEKVDLIISAMALHHVEHTDRLLKAFAQQLAPGGKLALADLDAEDGSFHPADIEGVYHAGFDRDELGALLEANGFEDVQFVTAAEVEKNGRHYPIFLLTATKR